MRQKLLLLGVFCLFCSISSADEFSKTTVREQPLPPEYEDFASSSGVEEEDELSDEYTYQGVKGRAGIDFPMLRRIPKTSFSCKNVKVPGYFADIEADCQVFHLCDGGRKMSFLCPNGTIFRQSKLTCDWWFKVDCKSSEEFYESSAEQLRQDREGPALKRAQETEEPHESHRSPSSTQQPSNHNRLHDEFQEVAETGSFIIPHQQNNPPDPTLSSRRGKAFHSNYSKYSPPHQPSSTTIPKITISEAEYTTIAPEQRGEITSRLTYDVTTMQEQTTTTQNSVTSDIGTTNISPVTETEFLQGSHSNWYHVPTGNPPTTQEDLNQVTFFTTPSPSLASARHDPELLDLSNLLGSTERAARGFSANPRPRPGLNNVPLSSSPQTLHSLATYFAADNETRQEMEKDANANTMHLMHSLPTSETSTESLQKLNPDLRTLAKIFSKALSDYLHDPETFRDTLNSIRPKEPTPLSRSTVDEEKDEVLEFSDNVNTRRTKVTSTTEALPPLSTTTLDAETEDYPTFTTEYPSKNEVASIVNDIAAPEELTARKIPDSASKHSIFINEETQYRVPNSNSVSYLPTESPAFVSSTTSKNVESNFLDTIPTSTSYPITPDPIPIVPSQDFPFAVPYVEIGYNKPRYGIENPTSEPSYFSPEPISVKPTYTSFANPSLDAVLQHFAPHDLNSLAILSVQTHPSPSPASPVSVALHLPPQTSEFHHRITVLASTHKGGKNNPIATTFRPMISKLLFPSPVSTEDPSNSTLDIGESLVVENTAGYPASFRSAQSVLGQDNAALRKVWDKEDLVGDAKVQSWLNEDKSVSQLITETIPTTYSPATTSEPVTEGIPTVDNSATTQEAVADVPRARKVGDDAPGSKVVFLLVKNDAVEPSDNKQTSGEEINRNKLLQALLQKDSGKIGNTSAAEVTTTTEEVFTTTFPPSTDYSSTDSSINVTSPTLTVTHSTTNKAGHEITTYRSAQHRSILNRLHVESSEVINRGLPESASLVLESSEESNNTTDLVAKLPPIHSPTNTTHSDGRAFDILKSLYSLASRWG